MTTYAYKAKKGTAETVVGQITAETEDEAIDLISQLGLLPVSLQAEDADGSVVDIGRPKKVGIKELYVFSQQLANLLKSGVTLLKSLTIIEQQTQHAYFKKVITRIAWSVKNGKSFSDSMAEFPRIFSPLYISMAHAGEESGNLQEMLRNVSIYQKKQDEVISRVRMALVYPLFMGGVGVVTVYFILTFVLPRMAPLFDSLGTDLPLPTLIMLNISAFLTKGWWILLIAIVGLSLSLYRWQQSQAGKRVISRMLIHLPLMGPIILKTELARFARSFVLLLKSGISIVNSLQIAIPILGNELIKNYLLKCKEDLISGGSLGESIQQFEEIPSMMGHLISVGEESGNLNEVLTELANTYEQEADEKIKLMTTLFEPIMILLIGIIIGFIVFAMLLPIFQMDALVQ